MSTQRTGTKEKHDAVTRLLEDEFMLVHVAPNVSGVTLPPHLLAAPSVTLKLSRLFRGALTVGSEKIEADLLFGSTYFTCVVPFAAIWGASSASGSNIVWPEDAPQEVRAQIVAPEARPASAPAASSPAPAEPPPSEKTVAGKSRSHLRRVK